ncbi:MAG: hypothetical protein GY754_35055 [bacterium]|nr:hypothetical protein [bacterium]
MIVTIAEILILYIIYLALIIFGSYYVNLFMTQDQYSKEELKNIKPYLSGVWKGITGNYSIATFFLLLIGSSFLGAVIPALFQYWILNSVLLFAIVFFTLPYLKKHFEQAQVSTPDNYSDTVVNIFVKYSDVLIIGFGTGLGTILMYNRASVHFLWFLVNVFAVTILLGISVKNVQKSS